MGILFAYDKCNRFSNNSELKATDTIVLGTTKPAVSADSDTQRTIPEPDLEISDAKGEVASSECAEKQRNVRIEIPLSAKHTPSRVLKRLAYTVSFNRNTNQPNWVAWCLTDEESTGTVPRNKSFYADSQIPYPHRVTTEDYKDCGYDRGHMAPAADMKFSAQAMRECFYMSNICPQNHELNAGSWQKLEEACRRWARRYGKVYIVCGPMFYTDNYKYIGREHYVPVPDAFFKCVYADGPKGPQAIAYIYNNTSTKQNMNRAATSVDAVEKVTGMDFFYMLPDKIETRVEKSVNIKNWQ